MNSPEAPRSDRVPVRRLFVWALVAAALLTGIGLYLKYGRAITPVLGGS